MRLKNKFIGSSTVIKNNPMNVPQTSKNILSLTGFTDKLTVNSKPKINLFLTDIVPFSTTENLIYL
ncbi:hypothetical protein [uncultured Tenacibaculum sp.]|uniref:hypothetical protein n=1 Tax=uncultured Tenacibaculum sp. TaxID=174713 RepID=UPI00260F93D4|nr:hypothetical protein [uncultured Tenacibaculum sp.]